MALILVLLFIVLPILEIWVIVQVGDAIGILPTIALLIVDGVLGAVLAKSQGARAWERFNLALAEGRMPAREVFDGAAILLGGALMLAPGFITDVFALFLLIPATRDLIRRFGMTLGLRRLTGSWALTGFAMRGASRARRGRADGPDTTYDPYRPPPPDYDYEGSAHEVVDPAAELDDGERRS